MSLFLFDWWNQNEISKFMTNLSVWNLFLYWLSCCFSLDSISHFFSSRNKFGWERRVLYLFPNIYFDQHQIPTKSKALKTCKRFLLKMNFLCKFKFLKTMRILSSLPEIKNNQIIKIFFSWFVQNLIWSLIHLIKTSVFKYPSLYLSHVA